jgi:hypothetical protein
MTSNLDPNAGYFYDGTLWHKIPPPRGVSTSFNLSYSNLNAVAGTNTLDTGSPGSGNVREVEAIDIYNNTNNGTFWGIRIMRGSVGVYLVQSFTPTAGRSLLWSGRVTLTGAEYIQAIWAGCTAGDDLYMTYHGVDFRIDY